MSQNDARRERLAAYQKKKKNNPQPTEPKKLTGTNVWKLRLI